MTVGIVRSTDLGNAVYGFEFNATKDSKTIDKVKTVFKKIEEIFKEFAQNILKVFKAGLQVTTALIGHLPEIVKKVKMAIASIGLASFITAFYDFISIPSKVMEIVEKGKIKDFEGIARAVMDTLASAAGCLDNVAGGVSAVAALGAAVASPVLLAFAVIAAPLAIGLLSYGIIKGTYDLVQNGIFLHNLKMQHQVYTINSLKDFIDDKLGVSNEEGKLKFNATKISIAERRSDKKVVKVMMELRKFLESQEHVAPNLIEDSFKHMKGIMARKIAVNSVSTASNVAMLGGLVALLVTPVAPLAIPIIAGVKSAVGVAKAGVNVAIEKWNNNWWNANQHRFAVAPA